VTAPQLSAVRASRPGSRPIDPRSTATPLYDALVHEYRQALRCVPGEHVFDSRLPASQSAPPVAVPTPAIPTAPNFPHELDALPYSRRVSGVPRQVSRHRGAAGDAPGQGRW